MKWGRVILAVIAAMVVGGVAGALCRIAPVLASQEPTGYWVWPTTSKSAIPTGPRYFFQGTIKDNHGTVVFEPGGISPSVGGPRHVYLVLRIEGVLPDSDIVASSLKSIASKWERDAIVVDGVQLDFDAPAAALSQYGSFLGSVRLVLPANWEFSITGLGSWLFDAPEAVRKSIASNVDYIAFQFYSGTHSIRHPEWYIRRLMQLGVNFKVGLLPSQAGASWLPRLILAQHFKGYMYFSAPKTGYR